VGKIVDEHLLKAFAEHARGTIVDIGCGTKPYESALKPYVQKHIGVDYPGTLHDTSRIDVFADAYNTTLPSASADTVLLSAVLEHLSNPQDALNEASRVLKPGGRIILTAPQFWHLHEAPHDYYRYTEFGLRHLLKNAGFEVIQITPLAGFIVMMCQEICYYINWRGGSIVHWSQQGLQRFAYWMYRKGRDNGKEFCWMHLAVGRKPE
jgi:ubiquinone/menaquinone biosynthesis C-methylase UbiE